MPEIPDFQWIKLDFDISWKNNWRNPQPLMLVHFHELWILYMPGWLPIILYNFFLFGRGGEGNIPKTRHPWVRFKYQCYVAHVIFGLCLMVFHTGWFWNPVYIKQKSTDSREVLWAFHAPDYTFPFFYVIDLFKFDNTCLSSASSSWECDLISYIFIFYKAESPDSWKGSVSEIQDKHFLALNHIEASQLLRRQPLPCAIKKMWGWGFLP